MAFGYEPSRLATLARQTRWALSRLDHIASTDPAADRALAATNRLRSVLARTITPTLASISSADPLGHTGHTGGTDWYADWLTTVLRTPLSRWTDDELFAELDRLELEVPYTNDFQPDMDDPFWNDYAALATELALRAETDEAFADRLVAQAPNSFLIPIAVRFARFDPHTVAGMLREVAATPSAVVDLRSNYQAFGAEGLLTFLIDFPLVALDLTATAGSGFVKELIEWPLIDSRLVAEFFDVAMAAPFADPTQLPRAYAVIQHLVTLANRSLHESGFPAAISPTLAKIVVQYLPFFVTSLNGHGDVHFKDIEFRDAGVRLGSYEEFLDLIGALLRDPASRDIVLAAVPGISVIGAGDNGGLGISPDDVADLVAAINRAALNEQLEEQLIAARAERDARWAIDVAFGALELVSTVTGPARIAGIEVPLDLLHRGTIAIVEWAITEADLGLDDIANLTFLLVVFGLSIGVLRGSADGDDTDDANEIVETIEERTAAGEPVDDLEGLINDLERVVRQLDDAEVLDILDDARVRPPDLDVPDATDLGH